jgi:hypothetical protein
MGKREPKIIDPQQISDAFAHWGIAFAHWGLAMKRAAQAMEDLVKSPEFQEFLAKHYPAKAPKQTGEKP